MENAVVVPSRARAAAALLERSSSRSDNEHPGDSAFCASTEFRLQFPIAVEPDCSVDDALQELKRPGDHALVVTRGALGGRDQQLFRSIH
jgi:hypothetical protein